MSAPRLAAIAAVAVSTALGGAPAAAFPPPDTPENAPAVAGPTPSGARLVVFDHRGRICGDVRLPRDDGSGPDCDRPSGRLRDSFSQTEFDGRGRLAWHWGFVAPEVAAVDVVLRGGAHVRVPTSAGEAYHGRFARRIRFFVAEARGREPSYLRLLAADGSLLAVVEHFFFHPRRVGPSVPVARGGKGAGGWSLRAFRSRALAPLPGDEERFVDSECIGLRPVARGARAEACVNPDFPRRDVDFGTDEACGPVGSVVVGLVTRNTRGVVATLGDGTRRRLPLRRLPERFRDRRAFALVLGPMVAIRSVVAVDRDGHRRELVEGRPPGASRCGETASFLYAFEEDHPPARGPLAFTVYDDGVLLCATLATPAPEHGDCGYPPRRDDEARILIRRTAGRTLVAGVVPEQVASAAVALASGERHRVVATAAGYYSGRYQNRVRFFSFELPGRRWVRSVRLFDERGRLVTTQPGDEPPRAILPPQRLLRGPGELGLYAEVDHWPIIGRSYLCVWLGRRTARHGCGLPGLDLLEVRVTCSPRRLLVWGLLPSVRSTLVLTDRGALNARVVRLPTALRRASPRLRSRAAFLAVVPPAWAPRALVFGDERRELRLPAAAAQCGYETFVSR